MKSIYCHHCDKVINRIFKQRHLKSKAHLYMYYNIVTNRYNIGKIFWSDFENIINEYTIDYEYKFYSFSILVKCKLNNENINI